MLPKAIVISIVISTVIYTLVSLVSISVVPWNVLEKSASPLTMVAEVTLGPGSGPLMNAIALVATGSTVIVLFFAFSRMIYGMAEKKSLPRLFMKVSKKRRVPYPALILVAVVTLIFISLQNLKLVASLTDFGALFVFMFVNLSLIFIRYRKPKLKGGFRVPLNIGKMPVTSLAGFLFSLYMLTTFGILIAAAGMIILAAGIVIFTVYLERKYITRNH